MQKLERGGTWGAPLSLPSAGLQQAPAEQKSILPTCPAQQMLVRSHRDAGRQRAAKDGRGELGDWGEPRVLAELAGVKEMSPRASQPCWKKAALCWAPRAAGGCRNGKKLLAPTKMLPRTPQCPRAPPLPAPWGCNTEGCCLPVLKMGKRSFNGRESVLFVFTAAQSGLEHKQKPEPGWGKGDFLENTHRETCINIQILYMHAHFSLFFLLSWREQWEQSQEKQISPTIPFRKFHFKPNQMMAPALGYV